MNGVDKVERKIAYDAIAFVFADGKKHRSAALGVVAQKALGLCALPYKEPGYRLADAWLQKQRKAGRATFVREGRDTMWFLKAEEKA